MLLPGLSSHSRNLAGVTAVGRGIRRAGRRLGDVLGGSNRVGANGDKVRCVDKCWGVLLDLGLSTAMMVVVGRRAGYGAGVGLGSRSTAPEEKGLVE